jgi:GTPase SAR1 family protein
MRILVAGDAMVGKTSILNHLTSNFTGILGVKQHLTGLGSVWIEFIKASKKRPLLFYHLDGIILVFDYSRIDSFRNLADWIADAPSVPILVVGTRPEYKVDLVGYDRIIALDARFQFDHRDFDLFYDQIVNSR